MFSHVSQKVILALEIVRLLVLMKLGKEINTIVWHFFCMAGASCYNFKLLSDSSLYSCLVLSRLSIVYSHLLGFWVQSELSKNATC